MLLHDQLLYKSSAKDIELSLFGLQITMTLTEGGLVHRSPKRSQVPINIYTSIYINSEPLLLVGTF